MEQQWLLASMGVEMNQQEQSWQAQRSVCAAICRGNGLKAREIARQLNMDRGTVNCPAPVDCRGGVKRIQM
jgi:DNA-binding NarL/FixJ family response regulator